MRSAVVLHRKRPHPLRRRKAASPMRGRARCCFRFQARRARMPWQRRPNDPGLPKKRPADSTLAISPPARLPFDPLAGPPAQAGQIGVIPQAREDPAMCEQSATRHHHDSVAADAKPLSVGHQGMDEIASLVETYLVAERNLVAAGELAGGALAPTNGP